MRRYVRPNSSQSISQELLNQRGFIHPWENSDITSPVFNQLPSYFRCTLQAIPSKSDTQLKCQIPLAVIMEPARVENPPTLDFSHSSIPRCEKCEAYLSCFCTLSSDKKKWRCALCNAENKFSQKYLSSFSSFRELSSSVYDMKAPHTYVQRQQIMKSYLFLIDVSKEAVESGFSQQFTKSIKSSIDTLPEYSSITIITYDKYVTLYDLNKPIETRLLEPSTYKVPPNYIGVLNKCRKNVDFVLNRIASITPERSVDGNCYGSALAVATSALRVYGGIIIGCCCSRPKDGPYSIKKRFSEKQEDEVNLFHMPSGTEENEKVSAKYQKLALKMNRFGVSLHLFLCSKEHCDAAVIAMPCGLTGGSCHYYPKLDPLKLHIDLFQTMSDKYMWHSSMKLRCSDGIIAERVIGNVTNSNDSLFFPVISSSSTLAITLRVWKPITQALFQAALLWSEGPGKRFIRIFNFSIPVTNDLSLLSSSIDEAALSTFMLKVTATNVINLGGLGSKELLLGHLKGILSSITDVRSIPFFMYSLLMHKLVEDSETSKTDERMAAILDIRRMSVSESLLYLYPRLINVKEKKVFVLARENIQSGIFALQEHSLIYVWGYPKENEEEARSMVSADGKAQGELVEISKEMMSITGRYMNIEYLKSDEGMRYASERLIENNNPQKFIDWVKSIWN